MGFLQEPEVPAWAVQAGADQWVVSGWTTPDGQAYLAPLLRAVCVPAPPVPGTLQLRLETPEEIRTIPFGPQVVPDLPSGYGHFCFTVPALGELVSAEVHSPGARPCRRLRTHALAGRAAALQAGIQTGGTVIRNEGEVLHLEWDSRLHPYVNVLHERTRRTTLALHLTGGSADVALDGLPAGGVFVIHFSDGLNPVVRIVSR